MPGENLRQMEDRKMTDLNEETEIKKVQAALDDLKQQSNAYPEDFVRTLKAEDPKLYGAFLEGTPPELDDSLAQVDAHLSEWEKTQEPKAAEAGSEAVLTSAQETQMVTLRLNELKGQKDWVSEDFLKWVKRDYPIVFDGMDRVANAHLTAKEGMVQNLLSDTDSLLALYNNKKGPALASKKESPAVKVSSEVKPASVVTAPDAATVKKEVAPATVTAKADSVAPVVPAAHEPVVETPKPVAKAAPIPETASAPAPKPEQEQTVAEDLKRKDIVANLKKENLQIVENFLASHPDITLKNTIDTGTNHREFRIGRPNSDITTSIHLNVRPLDIPTKPGDVLFTVGDVVFGKPFSRMEDALEGAVQLIKTEGLRVAAKEKKETEKARVAKVKEENKERLVAAKGKADSPTVAAAPQEPAAEVVVKTPKEVRKEDRAKTATEIAAAKEDRKEQNAQTKKDTEERIADAKGKNDKSQAPDTAINMAGKKSPNANVG